MRDPKRLALALRLSSDGMSLKEIAAAIDVAPSTAWRWLVRSGARTPQNRPRQPCDGFTCRTNLPSARYAYLLGMYLGDGTILKGRRDVYRLAIYCASAYPEIIEECRRAIALVGNNNPGVYQLGDQACVKVNGYSKHWPHLFPQMGPGMKHTRTIALEPWQREIARAHPEKLIRGLIHSDGCRVINRIHKNGKTYAYPRYHFSNESTDIIGIFTDVLDQLGIAWRMNRPNSVSIARRASVAALDVIVGPKT